MPDCGVVSNRVAYACARRPRLTQSHSGGWSGHSNPISSAYLFRIGRRCDRVGRLAARRCRGGEQTGVQKLDRARLYVSLRTWRTGRRTLPAGRMVERRTTIVGRDEDLALLQHEAPNREFSLGRMLGEVVAQGSLGFRGSPIDVVAHVESQLLARDVARGGSSSLLTDQPSVEETP